MKEINQIEELSNEVTIIVNHIDRLLTITENLDKRLHKLEAEN